MSLSITGPSITDDNGTGTTGTILNASLFTSFYAAINAALAKAAYTLFSAGTGGNNTAGVETDMYTGTIPANTLSADGASLDIHIQGFTATNGNTKTVRVYLGGQLLNGLGFSSGFNGQSFALRIRVCRANATTVSYTQIGAIGATVGTNYNSNSSVDFTSSQVLRVTAEASGAGDVAMRGWSVTYLAA